MSGNSFLLLRRTVLPRMSSYEVQSNTTENVPSRRKSLHNAKLHRYLALLVGVSISFLLVSHYNKSGIDLSRTRFDWDTHLGFSSLEYSVLKQHKEQKKLTSMPRHKDDNKLIYFNHSNAFDMLISSKQSLVTPDFFHYMSSWDAQITPTYCAVASVTTILNSLRGLTTSSQNESSPLHPWDTQRNLVINTCAQEFIPLNNGETIPRLKVGLGLLHVKRLLMCRLSFSNYEAVAYAVDPSTWTTDDLREAILEALYDEKSRIIINYDRGGIGQGDTGRGHFSPIGAYNEEKDTFLIMDVAKFKYPPVWVSTSQLMNGIGTIDNCGDFDYPTKPLDYSKGSIEVNRQLHCVPSYRGIIIVKPSTR